MENIYLQNCGILGAKALFNLKPGHCVAKAKVKVHLRGNSRDDRLEQIHAANANQGYYRRIGHWVDESDAQTTTGHWVDESDAQTDAPSKEGMVQVKLGVP